MEQWLSGRAARKRSSVRCCDRLCHIECPAPRAPLRPPRPPQILDGTPLRYGLPPMSVSKAKFEQKGDQFVARTTNKKQVTLPGQGARRRAPGRHSAWCASERPNPVRL